MREIISHQLWLGHAIDVRDVRRLHDAGIKAVVDLAYEEPCAQLSRDMLYCRFPLIDGADNSPKLLATAISTTLSLIRKEIPTIVACSAGMSRSPCIVAAALAVICGKSPDECLQDLIEGQPHDIAPRLWADIQRRRRS
jgi:protein-tyrosine phosphatase